MIGIIAAVSKNGIIGKNNELAFYYRADLQNFKKITTNHIVIMGRKTFESIGKPLPNRKNIVITSQPMNNTSLSTFTSLDAAMADQSITMREPSVNVWLIGGGMIYEAGMKYADIINLTIAQDYIDGDNLTRFPWINPLEFNLSKINVLDQDNKLMNVIYQRSKFINDTI